MPRYDDWRRTKPLFGWMELNRFHPLAKYHLFSILFQSGGAVQTLSSPPQVTPLGSGDAWTRAYWGPSVSFDGSSSANCRLVMGTQWGGQLAATQAVTFFALCQSADAAGSRAVIDQTGSGDGTNSAAQLFTESGTWKFRTVDAGTNHDVIGASVTTDPVSAAGTWSKTDTSIRLYINGAASGTPGTQSANFSDVSGNLLIGSLGSSVFPWNGTISLIHVWNRQLAAGEILWLHKEPYVFLQPKVVRTFVIPSIAYTQGWLRKRS